jgi:hypothetical protein
MAHTHDQRLTKRQFGALLILGAVLVLLGGAAAAQDQTTNAPNQPQVQALPGEPTPSDQDVYGARPQTATAPATTPDAASPQASTVDSDSPPVYSLQSGLPLQSKISPLRWGRLSLLSFSLMETYEAGAQMPAGEATLASGLVIYSVDHTRSHFNFQYMPMAWYASGNFHNNFTAHAVDLSTGRNFGRFWRVTFADQYHYSPNLTFMSASSFNPDFSSGSATRNPFFLLGRKSIVNNASLNVNRQLDGSNQLNVTLNNSFTRLSEVTDPQAVGTISLPTDEQLFYSGNVAWSHRFSGNGSMSLSYGYSDQQERNNHQRLQYQNVTAGYTRRLTPTITMTVQAGPAWSKRSVTAQGSVGIYKSFRHGGVAAAFSRDTEFVGILGGGFHNRYDLSFQQRLWTRWGFSVGSSYVQQRLPASPRSSNGVMTWSSLSYRLSPSWSVYSSYFYMNFGSNLNIPTAREAAVLGIRWAWAPESSGR